MALTPGYGDTPLADDELSALLPELVDVLDKPITRADIYDLEQGLQGQVVGELMPAALDGSLPLDELLSDSFIRDLHMQMFGRVWDWAAGGAKLSSTSASPTWCSRSNSTVSSKCIRSYTCQEPSAKTEASSSLVPMRWREIGSVKSPRLSRCSEARFKCRSGVDR